MTRPTQTIYIQRYASPCGELVLGEADGALCLCDWTASLRADKNRRRLERILNANFVLAPSPVTRQAAHELNEYFAGERQSFDLPLLPAGTDFQKKVWSALLEIPYGQTTTYLEVARRVGTPKSVRAVSQAIGANAISIFIPCHRVIGSNDTLTGYAGGLDAKSDLLRIENPDTLSL